MNAATKPGEIMDSVADLHGRVTKLEGAFVVLERMDKKLDQIHDLTARITGIEQQHLNNSTAIERLFHTVERFDKDEEHRTDKLSLKIAEIDKEVANRVSWAKGAWFAASILWFLIQALIIAYMLSLESRQNRFEKHLDEVVEITRDSVIQKQSNKFGGLSLTE